MGKIHFLYVEGSTHRFAASSSTQEPPRPPRSPLSAPGELPRASWLATMRPASIGIGGRIRTKNGSPVLAEDPALTGGGFLWGFS